MPHEAHAHARTDLAAARRRALLLALGANGAFLVLEVAAGFAFNSLALLADSAHMVTDVAALSIALVAQRLATAPASDRHTYGLVRAEVLGGLLNAVLLSVVSVWIVVEAIGRFGSPGDVNGPAVVVVALVGLAVNAMSAWWIAQVGGRSLNLRAAFWHLVGDALGSLGALAAGVAVWLWGAEWVDPAASILIVVLVMASVVGLVRDALRVLLEDAPAGLHLDEIERALAAEPGVEAVHHTHVWSLGSETPALSTHVVLVGEPSLHEAQLRGATLKRLLVDRFGIEHATIELECHACVDDEVHA